MLKNKTSDISIKVSNLDKCYQIYDKPRDRLKQLVYPRFQRFIGLTQKDYYQEFWALKNVSFEVKKGEAVGIMGRNGSGKSTLLQLICKTLTPTNGLVEVYGTVAALLELGSGFNPEFTGRENVYMNAALLGLTQEETNNKFDEIAAFADIGDFLYQQTKVYSSGMLMRLAFAVNICVDPEILIVDEALGVGDAPFQSKCFKRLRKLIDDGKSILFVSHDISTVRSICSRALWLKSGQTEMWGGAQTVAKEYEKFCWEEQGVVLGGARDSPEKPTKISTLPTRDIDFSSFAPSLLFEPNPSFDANRLRSKIGTGVVVIKNLLLLNKAGFIATSCDFNEELTVYYLLEICSEVDSDFIIGVRFRDTKGNFVYSLNDIGATHRIKGAPNDKFIVSTKIKIPLTHADYVMLTGIFGFNDGKAFDNGLYDFSKSVIWEVIEDAVYLKVNAFEPMPMAGPVNANMNLTIRKIN